ncbi:NAD(P)-dependent oxidoreductase [Rathayibacter caricis DSM 15933]|uniref:NAD(P)-dependent oxidoreductase n=1 Tax=Rathayibacter caricis DSM 15933 TaxID=1328867 RepID=A0A2T4UQX4_9MICO|nr:NmrA family NAD(P)-binding protein [Rathayibacter caricis]PTL71913.1 NAD(P)-dependent oxidoreductase [Rathayibacter caricis DSM 15933]
MTIAIIGATGSFGGDIINALLARGVDPPELLALGRNSNRLDELQSRGLRTAAIDISEETVAVTALTGVDTLLLISIGAPGEGLALRTAAVNAAKVAGVKHLVYTSALQASTTTFVLASEHAATEEVVIASGIPPTFVRVGWYTENLQQDFESARASEVIANSIGAGRLATAPRRDMAEAIAVVLTTPGQEGLTYELSGDVAWDYTEFAEAAKEVLGAPVRYDALTPEQEREMLTEAGLDEQTVSFIGMLNTGLREGTQASTTGDLARLIARPTTTLVQSLRNWR